MKKETKSIIAFFLFIMAYILTYLAGYYAEVTNGWSHLLVFLSFILMAAVLFIESPSKLKANALPPHKGEEA